MLSWSARQREHRLSGTEYRGLPSLLYAIQMVAPERSSGPAHSNQSKFRMWLRGGGCAVANGLTLVGAAWCNRRMLTMLEVSWTVAGEVLKQQGMTFTGRSMRDMLVLMLQNEHEALRC